MWLQARPTSRGLHSRSGASFLNSHRQSLVSVFCSYSITNISSCNLCSRTYHFSRCTQMFDMRITQIISPSGWDFIYEFFFFFFSIFYLTCSHSATATASPIVNAESTKKLTCEYLVAVDSCISTLGWFPIHLDDVIFVLNSKATATATATEQAIASDLLTVA